MLAVSTFHPESFSLYARRSLTSLARFFPGKVLAYAEEPVEAPDGVEIRDFWQIPDAAAYVERLKNVAGSDGRGSGHYDFRYDASRFCRKVFVQDAVFDEADLVFWFDADTVVKQAIPEAFLRKLLAGHCVTYLGRKRSYSETGFVGFNTAHEDFPMFRSRYLSYFTSGRIFEQLKGWHDCIAFDRARGGLAGNNLSPNGKDYHQVIQDSCLAQYVDHHKGNRKFRAARRDERANAGAL